jgi:hypothetical protein
LEHFKEALLLPSEYYILDAVFIGLRSADMYFNFDKIRSGINSGSFRFLGYGAGRRVYDIGNGYVVKIAKNRFGIYQNKNEYRLALMYKGDLLAKAISVSGGYRMLVMQAAKTLNDIKPVLNYFNVKATEELYYAPELVGLARKHHLVMREFFVSRNWGLINDKPVIIDYGFIKRHRRWPWPWP